MYWTFHKDYRGKTTDGKAVIIPDQAFDEYPRPFLVISDDGAQWSGIAKLLSGTDCRTEIAVEVIDNET